MITVVALSVTPSSGSRAPEALRSSLPEPRDASPLNSSGFGSPWLAWPRLTSVDHMVAWPVGSAEDDVPLAAEAYDARSAGEDFEPNDAGTNTSARRTRVRRSDSSPRRR